MNETGVVRRIDWRELFPWLILLRVFRVAIAPAPLMLSTLAVLLTAGGWWISGALFLPKQEFKDLPARPEQLAIPAAAAAYLPTGKEAVLQPIASLVQPVRELLSYDTSGRRVAYYLFGWLIAVAVWAFVGGVISRQALIELGCEQSYDMLDSVGFVMRRYLQYLFAPLAPLLALGVMGLLLVPLGWLMNWPFGVFLAGLAWIFVVLLGLVAAWLIVGLLFGWPLMYGAIGSKRDGDALQAFSDAFSYVYGKPLHYFFYTVVALMLGALGLAAVMLFAQFAIEFGFWATSWGAGAKDIEVIRTQLVAVQLGQELKNVPATQRYGVHLISAVLGLVQSAVLGVAYSYFFVASAAIFLLMRLRVDEKEMDEIHLEDEETHLETARRAMLSDEIPPAKPEPAPAPVLAPTPEPEQSMPTPAAPPPAVPPETDEPIPDDTPEP